MIERLIIVHLADKKATLASVGALYAVMMLSKPEEHVWPRINRAIMDRFSPPGDGREFRKLEAVKAHAWRLAEALS